jgi:hypothetical protein
MTLLNSHSLEHILIEFLDTALLDIQLNAWFTHDGAPSRQKLPSDCLRWAMDRKARTIILAESFTRPQSL